MIPVGDRKSPFAINRPKNIVDKSQSYSGDDFMARDMKFELAVNIY
jgi:hypothetical protein